MKHTENKSSNCPSGLINNSDTWFCAGGIKSKMLHQCTNAARYFHVVRPTCIACWTCCYTTLRPSFVSRCLRILLWAVVNLNKRFLAYIYFDFFNYNAQHAFLFLFILVLPNHVFSVHISPSTARFFPLKMKYRQWLPLKYDWALISPWRTPCTRFIYYMCIWYLHVFTCALPCV